MFHARELPFGIMFALEMGMGIHVRRVQHCVDSSWVETLDSLIEASAISQNDTRVRSAPRGGSLSRPACLLGVARRATVAHSKL